MPMHRSLLLCMLWDDDSKEETTSNQGNSNYKNNSKILINNYSSKFQVQIKIRMIVLCRFLMINRRACKMANAIGKVCIRFLYNEENKRQLRNGQQAYRLMYSAASSITATSYKQNISVQKS